MYPSAADPWQPRHSGADPPAHPDDPSARPARLPDATGPVMYGRAPVPPAAARTEMTAELPVVPAAPMPVRPTKPISWRRASRASLRSLADGWGFTATGVIVAVSGWGIWAAAGRGTLASPFVGIVLTLTVAALLFALTRLLGYLLVERLIGRPRLHARWSHLLAGLFLCFAGLAYLRQTSWIVEGVDWVGEGVDRVGEGIDWIRRRWQRVA